MSGYLDVVFTSAVVATLTGALVNHYSDFFKLKRTSRRDALSLVIELEGYVLLCADKLSEHNIAVSSDNSAGHRLTTIPELPSLANIPAEVGLFWFKKPKLANRILVLPQEHKIAKQSADFWWKVVGDSDCADNASVSETAKIALLVLKLAKDIRKEFSLPARDLIFDSYDVENVICNHIE
ncbi:hypothetical protein [Vibrio cholerae]|uniref:hypothetical protein n=1 Tax=Vibrio cholerae TaxID=666 RepID=UPI00157A57BC|nr:hypothetical protein [Vibrio cholerae]CAB1261537.1 Uncharacterised protein [Vibrio cholerae]